MGVPCSQAGCCVYEIFAGDRVPCSWSRAPPDLSCRQLTRYALKGTRLAYVFITGTPAIESMFRGWASYKKKGVVAMSKALRLRARVLLLLGCALATLLPVAGVGRAVDATDY